MNAFDMVDALPKEKVYLKFLSFTVVYTNNSDL